MATLLVIGMIVAHDPTLLQYHHHEQNGKQVDNFHQTNI